ncbi:MAG: thiol-disulfide oxidoreductase DCC family protein [Pseudomonadota bacterium]
MSAAEAVDVRVLLVQHPRVILFDGVCNVCNGWVKFVTARDPQAKFHFASMQSPAGQALLAHVGLPLDHYDTLVYIENGEHFLRSTAVMKVVSQLSGPASLLSAMRILPRPLRDFGYDRFAQNRYRLFGQSDTCMVPTPALRQRFL